MSFTLQLSDVRCRAQSFAMAAHARKTKDLRPVAFFKSPRPRSVLPAQRYQADYRWYKNRLFPQVGSPAKARSRPTE